MGKAAANQQGEEDIERGGEVDLINDMTRENQSEPLMNFKIQQKDAQQSCHRVSSQLQLPCRSFALCIRFSSTSFIGVKYVSSYAAWDATVRLSRRGLYGREEAPLFSGRNGVGDPLAF